MRLTHSRRALIVLGAASLSLVVTAGVAPARAMQMATGLTVRVSALNAGTRVIPAHVPAGIVPFTVIDDLTEPASALIFRVNTGYTPAQAIAIFTDQKATQARLNRAASFVAGFTAFAPGQHLSGWIHLTPGSYVVSSLGNFRAHTQTFRVDAAARAPLGAPASAATVTMEENKFAMPAVLPAGHITLKVVNADTDIHLGYVTRLARKVSLQQLKAALTRPEKEQPAWLHSAAPTGAAGILSHGQVMWWTLNLTSGHYAIICPLPGPDGKPHFMMGMLKLFDVR
jgi:hypothetical protein